MKWFHEDVRLACGKGMPFSKLKYRDKFYCSEGRLENMK